MSCLVKTTTPFLNEDILLEAIKKCGYTFEIKNDKIYIPELYQYRNTYFKLSNGKYVISYDSYNSNISGFLSKLELSYNAIYEQKLKEERERLERERLEYIEKQKKAIYEQAKMKGYQVIEKKENNKIKLTLVRKM